MGSVGSRRAKSCSSIESISPVKLNPGKLNNALSLVHVVSDNDNTWRSDANVINSNHASSLTLVSTGVVLEGAPRDGGGRAGQERRAVGHLQLLQKNNSIK